MKIIDIPDDFRFGQVQSWYGLSNLKDYIDKNRFVNEIRYDYKKVTTSAAGAVLDLSEIIGDDIEAPSMVDEALDGHAVLFLDRASNSAITVDYCGSRDGAVYSSSATFQTTNAGQGMWCLRWNIYSENLQNNCKVRFVKSASITMRYLVLVFFRKTGKTYSYMT